MKNYKNGFNIIGNNYGNITINDDGVKINGIDIESIKTGDNMENVDFVNNLSINEDKEFENFLDVVSKFFTDTMTSFFDGVVENKDDMYGKSEVCNLWGEKFYVEFMCHKNKNPFFMEMGSRFEKFFNHAFHFRIMILESKNLCFLKNNGFYRYNGKWFLTEPTKKGLNLKCRFETQNFRSDFNGFPKNQDKWLNHKKLETLYSHFIMSFFREQKIKETLLENKNNFAITTKDMELKMSLECKCPKCGDKIIYPKSFTYDHEENSKELEEYKIVCHSCKTNINIL